VVSRQSIQDEIRGFVSRYRSEHGTETGWRPPLVGFATVKDPLFAALKRVVSPSHALPDDLLPGARTVIAYFVPFENAVGESNIDGQMASPQWVRAYMETNTLLEEVGACAKELIETAGESVADVVYHDGAGWFMMPLAVLILWGELWLLSKLLLPPGTQKPLAVRPALARAGAATGKRRSQKSGKRRKRA